MRRRLVCWLMGHVPVWAEGMPSADYKCDRCGRRIWFWSGQRTGWFLAPEDKVANAYRGLWKRRTTDPGDD